MKKRICSLLFIVILLTGIGLIGCKDTNTENNKKKVNLIMYLIGSEGEDHEIVMQELNKKLSKDLNCTLTIRYIGLGDYSRKYPLILSSGEQIDLIMAANWLDYSNLSRQGVFLPLEGLVEKYCPRSYEELEMDTLRLGDPNGHIYMLPCNYTEPAAWGAIVRGDVMEQLGYEEIPDMETYFKFCIDVHQKTGFQDSSSQTLHVQDEVLLYSYGYCPVDGSSGATYWFNVKRGDETGEYTVYNKYEIPELNEYLKNAQDLCERGAWSKSALANTNANLMHEGLAASFLHLPNRWTTIADRNPSADVRFYNMADPVYIPSGHIYIGMAVPAISEYPELALQVLELFHQDESYYNLLTCGIEGKHYEIDEKTGELKLKNQTGYPYENGTWGFRDQKFYRELYPSSPNYHKTQEEIKGKIYDNIFRTFLLDTTNIENEYAAVSDVMSKEYTLLSMGYVDYESGMEQLREVLRAAGDEKCKAEIQKQVNAFALSHHKKE